MYIYRMSVISFIEVISIHHLQLEIQENVLLDASLLWIKATVEYYVQLKTSVE